jgi:MbtH protein
VNAGVVWVLMVIGMFLIAGLLLAMRGRARKMAKAASEHKVTFEPEDLFVTVSPPVDDLLTDWRWKVGDDAEVWRVTVFGDLFIRTRGGHFFRLDTGTGQYEDVAGSVTEWSAVAGVHGKEWFHADTLLALRGGGVKLAPGQVYSWRQPPFLGGAETADNVDLIDATVHVSHAGRLAQALENVPAGAKIDRFEFEPVAPPGGPEPKVWEVVINGDRQYSMWPAGTDLPTGWKRAGKQGTKDECLEYISSVWTDLRPGHGGGKYP